MNDVGAGPYPAKPGSEHKSVDGRLAYQVEVCQVSPSTLRLGGWAFDRHGSRVVRMQARLFGRNDDHVPRALLVDYGRERLDVLAQHDEALAQFCGFYLEAPAPGFSIGKAVLAFELDDGSVSDVTVKPRRQAFPVLTTVKSLLRLATIGNIKLAAGWIASGQVRRLIREISGAVEHDLSPPARPMQLSAALSLINDGATLTADLPQPVDIIIPVYNGYEYLEPLFGSLLRNTNPKHRMVVIEDCGPDVRVRPKLRSLLASFENALLIENEENLGFVRSVNRASQEVSGDFVLLNSDTVVPPGWLERLMAPIVADRTVCSTTPFSNAATVCSFPRFCEDNPMLGGLDTEALDRAFGKLRADEHPIELWSGVGFCMGMNGDVWRQIGPLDAETFGLGFGEENDWSLRARASGFRNLMVTNLFVQHAHGGSFEPEKRSHLLETNLRKVQARFPDYEEGVDTFIKRDPAAIYRHAAVLNLAAEAFQANCTLVIDHQMGGGANAYRRSLIERLVGDGEAVGLLSVKENPPSPEDRYGFTMFIARDVFEFATEDAGEIERFVGSKLKPKHIFYNNCVGFPDPLAEVARMRRMKVQSDARLTMAIHDFYPIAASYTLLDDHARYIEPMGALDGQEALMLGRFAANPMGASLAQWRETWGALAQEADEILCFSTSSSQLIAAVHPTVGPKIRIEPHALPHQFDRLPKRAPGSDLVIGVVGGINVQKGLHVVDGLAKHLLKSRPKARIVLIGHINGPRLPSNVIVTGPYNPLDLPTLIESYGVQVCLMPSIWPETFSYVTAELMTLGMPVVAFDIGAPAERLADYPSRALIPLSARDKPDDILVALEELIEREPYE